MGRSVTESSPAKCGLSDCDLETLSRRPRPIRAVET
jgi:hypothetical protein